MTSPIEFEALLNQRESIRERIEDINASPRPLAESEPDLALIVAAAASHVAPGLGAVAQQPGGWQDVLHAFTPAPVFLPAVASPIPVGDATFNLLCAVQPDAVMKFLRAELKKSYQGLPAPLASTDKATKLKAAREELRETERQISELWWAAEGEGVLLPVPDIDPSTFLGAS